MLELVEAGEHGTESGSVRRRPRESARLQGSLGPKKLVERYVRTGDEGLLGAQGPRRVLPLISTLSRVAKASVQRPRTSESACARVSGATALQGSSATSDPIGGHMHSQASMSSSHYEWG